MPINTFDVYQNDLDTKLILRPNAAGANTDFTPVGEASNYLCVDESYPDDDTTYVYMNNSATEYDLYALPDQSATGTIDWVRVYARGKNEGQAPEPGYIYKIICSDDNGVTVNKSGNLNLVSDYTRFGYTWNTNPRTGLPWTWDDINNLQIGVEASSPTNSTQEYNTTIQPNAAGDKTELSPIPIADANWECVDEIPSDENLSYVWQTSSVAWKVDLYNCNNPTGYTGTINSVTVYMRCKAQTGSGEAQTRIKTGGTEYDGGTETLGNSFQTYSYTWTVNPNTSVAWTWADINALQIGVRVKSSAGTQMRCTQVYAVVNHTETTNPEIRTTQVYAVVGYNTNVQCVFPVPEEIITNQSNIITELNFWSGDRVVFSNHRDAKRILLKGIVATDFIETSITCSFDEYYTDDRWDQGDGATAAYDLDDNTKATSDVCGGGLVKCSKTSEGRGTDYESDNENCSAYEISKVEIRVLTAASASISDVYLYLVYPDGTSSSAINIPLGAAKTWSGWQDFSSDAGWQDMDETDIPNIGVKLHISDSAAANKTVDFFHAEARISKRLSPKRVIDMMIQIGKNDDPIDIIGLDSMLWDRQYQIASFGWKLIQEKPELYEYILELEYTELES